MMDVMSPSAMIDKYGYHLEQFNDIYYPKGLLGVTSFGKEKETGEQHPRPEGAGRGFEGWIYREQDGLRRLEKTDFQHEHQFQL